jgi:uncharacterized protein YecT (DUF1311 family)
VRQIFDCFFADKNLFIGLEPGYGVGKYQVARKGVLIMTNWEREDNPIDKELKSCMNDPEHYSTYGMMECEQKAYDAWDKELNVVYKQLMSELGPKEQQDLKEDQRNWLKFRDSELKFTGDIYGQKEGTMWKPMAIDASAEIIKDRTLQLHHRLDVLNE